MSAEVSVVVPLYRTADALPELYRRTVAALEGRTFELVLVDDACPEGSGRVAAALNAGDERVHLVSLARNVGQHAAALAGLARANGAWAVVLDGDLQDPPEAIPLLLDAGRAAGVPVVFAGRRGRYESRMRLLTSRIYKRTLALVAGVPADAGIFMALDRSVAERLVALGGRRRPSLVAMVGCLRVPMISIPVTRAPRPSGRSSYGALGRLRLGVRAITWALAWRLRGAR
jgi:glycosyltransferase involved in cell wall biosynthesis